MGPNFDFPTPPVPPSPAPFSSPRTVSLLDALGHAEACAGNLSDRFDALAEKLGAVLRPVQQAPGMPVAPVAAPNFQSPLAERLDKLVNELEILAGHVVKLTDRVDL